MELTCITLIRFVGGGREGGRVEGREEGKGKREREGGDKRKRYMYMYLKTSKLTTNCNISSNR